MVEGKGKRKMEVEMEVRRSMGKRVGGGGGGGGGERKEDQQRRNVGRETGERRRGGIERVEERAL